MLDELRDLFLRALEFDGEDTIPLTTEWNAAIAHVQEVFDRMTDKDPRLVERPRWIPVEEGLPEDRVWVLCKCRAKIHEVLRWQNGEWYHDPQHRYMTGFVTHWMPLPEAPT